MSSTGGGGMGWGGMFHDTRMKARLSPWGCRGDGNSRGAVMGGEGNPPPLLYQEGSGKVSKDSGVQLKVDLPVF